MTAEEKINEDLTSLSGYTIRDIEASDIENIAAMHKENFSDCWTVDMIKGSFYSDGFYGGLIETYDNREQKTGTCIVENAPQSEDNTKKIACTVMFSSVLGEAELLSVVTERSFRRKGLGELLLKRYFDKLKADGEKTIFLEVRESNKAAISLYDKLGFVKISERKKYYGEETAVIMRKEL